MFIYDDNFLDQFIINEIDNIFKSHENKWGYNPTTLDQDYYNYNEIVPSEEFGDTQYFHMSPEPGTRAYEFANIVAREFMSKHNMPEFDVFRIRFNITPTAEKSLITRPHVDWAEPHLILLYYVNDSEGDTILYNETFNGSKIEKVSVMTKVSPKKGSAFLVNGEHYHSLVVPEKGDLRKVINFNLIL